MENRVVKIGLIGLGARAETLLASIFEMSGVSVAMICDMRPERIARILSIFDRHQVQRPRACTDHRELIADGEVEAVFVPTSWNSHLKIACDCMKQGKYVGIEVGGASSVQELWHLIEAAQTTGGDCMMLENCCYSRNEMMVLNMVRKGLFGEIVHCSCGYEHDIAYEMVGKEGLLSERAVHNYHRNGDLYPTHGIGPIAKILRINRGNRFLSISSFASKACGFQEFAKKTGCPLQKFNIGDVITSVIRCANGETIVLTHGVSLPRPYSRDCRVQGTKGIWLEDAKGIYIDGISPTEELLDNAGNPYITHRWDPVDSFYEKYDHPIWQRYREQQIGGHGGTDALTMGAFLDAVRNHKPTPIDVYDCAAWMSITALSEQSIAIGGAPVPFPDFTDGLWIDRGSQQSSEWSLD